MRLRLVIIVRALLALIGAPVKAADPSGGGLSEDHRAARERAGLQINPDGPTSVSSDYGFAVTARELALLHRADRDVEAGSRFAATHNDDPAFGGAWYDRQENQTVIAALGDADHLKVDAAKAGFEGPLRFTTANVSLSEWKSNADTITAAAIRGHVDFASIGYSVPENTVVVTAPEPSRAKAALGASGDVVFRFGENSKIVRAQDRTAAQAGKPVFGLTELVRGVRRVSW